MVGDVAAASAGARARAWPTHVCVPAAFFLAAAATIHAFDLDRRIAQALFFDAHTATWIGAETWWAEPLIHGGGLALVRAIGLGALLTFVGGFWIPSLRPLRRYAGYVALALALCPTVVYILKLATNVDCPRDLAGFGGTRPYVHLFEDRPDGLPRAACFPGSHASAGFALMAFYFVWMEARPRLARIALAVALLIGMVFSFGQQSRGAHFLSHDLTSAAVDWFLLLGLARLLLRSPRTASSRWITAVPGVPPVNTGAAFEPGNERREATHPAHARGRRAGLRGVFQRLLSACLPLRSATPERRRGGGPRGSPGDARQNDAPDRRLSRRVGLVHVDLPDLPSRSGGLHPFKAAARQAPGADR